MATNHHDTGYKELFSHPEFVQQLIEGFAPAEISGLMDFRTLKNHSGNYITPLFEEKFEGIMDRHGYLCGTDRIITRWLKRHLTRLGAGIHLNQLDSLVEDRDMLAENLENLVKKERLEGRDEGREEGREEGQHEARKEVARNLINRTEMDDTMIAEISGLAVEDVGALRSGIKH